MPRTLSVVALVPLLAVAAPVPKASPKLADLYGEPTDAKGDCTLEMGKRGVLTVTVPISHRAVDVRETDPLPPLAAKLVDGDFVATVRVAHSLPIAPGTAFPRRKLPPAPTVAAGLVAFAEGSKSYGVMATVCRDWSKAEWGTTCLFLDATPTVGGMSGVHPPGVKPDHPLYLRVSRRGEKVTQAWSADGEKWETKRTCELAGPVLVGPVAFQSTDKEFAATFDQYELKELPKEKEEK